MGSLAKRIPGISVEAKQIQDDYIEQIRAEAKQIQANYRLLSAPNKKDADASYEVGGAYTLKDALELHRTNIQVTTGAADLFGTSYQDILSVERYKLPRVKSVEIADRWRSSPMRFW